ncbi:MAG: dihydrodipicolinate synthase family protein [Deltaproteobacteria bacterium]|nr:dihydrodipicolinate synthase family protein [Deltaproteobacteria bacterium]
MEVFTAPKGLIVDLISPLNNNGSIDGRGLGRLLDLIIPHADAILLSSPYMGEGRNLDLIQKLELLEKALVVIRGSLPILFWVTQETEDKTRETVLVLNKALKKRAYTGQVFWIDSSLYYHSNRGLLSHYQDICSMVDQGIILHNDPELIKERSNAFKRNNIRSSILKELTFLPGIVGMIFFGSLARAHNYQEACRRRSHFRIYDGDESHFLDHPSMSGVISAGANLAPRVWQSIVQSSLQMTGFQQNHQSYHRHIRKLGHYLQNLKEIYHAMPVPIVKGVLSNMKIIETPASTLPTKNVKQSVNKIMDQVYR